MEKYEVIGIETVDYVSQKTQRNVKGRRLHLVYDFPERKVNAEGNGVEQIFTNCENAYVVKLGDIVELSYNKWGNVSDIIILDK